MKNSTYEELAKNGLWRNKHGQILDIRNLNEGYLRQILNYCNQQLAEYIREELDYRANPTEKWVKDWLFR